MYEQSLTQTGLSAEQATVYETLLKLGPNPARKIAQAAPYKRTLVYKILDDLQKLGLVARKDEVGKISIFEPAHPNKLKELAETRERQAQNAQISLEGILGQMISDFNLISGKPGVRFFEGINGLKQIYKDILDTGQNYFLIRSIYEPVYTTEIIPILEDFIKQRVRKGMSATAITPIDDPSKMATREDDQKRLYNRTWIPKTHYTAPVEIDIYGNKIAILSFGKEVVGIIFQSPQIAQALKQIFLLAQAGAKLLSNPSPPAASNFA